MRARRKRKFRFEDMLPQMSGGIIPETNTFEQMLEGDPEIAVELLEQEKALESAFSARRAINRRGRAEMPRIPLIAGYTDMANASPEMRAAGYLEWLSKSPQQRYEDSALGKAVNYSMSSKTPGDPQLSNMAQGNSYWADLARNIATGSDLPTARLPKLGESTSVHPNMADRALVETSQPTYGSAQNTYTGFADQSYPTARTQTPGGVQQSALGNKETASMAARVIQGESPAALKSQQRFMEYIGNTYGVTQSDEIWGIYRLLRGE